MFFFDLFFFVNLFVSGDVRLQTGLKQRFDILKFLLLLWSRIKEGDHCLVIEAKFKQSQCFSLIGNQIDDVILTIVHLFLVIFGQSGIVHQIVVE